MRIKNTQEKTADLMTKQEVINYLNISATSLYRLSKTDDFPRELRLAGAIRYRKNAIDQWLEAQANASMTKEGE